MRLANLSVRTPRADALHVDLDLSAEASVPIEAERRWAAKAGVLPVLRVKRQAERRAAL